MKTRIIYTKFWEDDYIGSLSTSEKILFFYLLTNSRVGLGSTYECADRVICFETGISSKQLVEIKEKFEKDMKFLFEDGYVFIVNCEKYNQFKGVQNEIAKEREEELIGKARITRFQDRVSIGYPYPSDTTSNHNHNHKSITINHKSKGEIIPKDEVELKKIVDIYNEVFEKNISSTRGFEKNYLYWKDIHSLEKIGSAIENARRDKFWKNKMTLTILFRQKNGNGEEVDYIEDLSNRETSSGGNIAII